MAGRSPMVSADRPTIHQQLLFGWLRQEHKKTGSWRAGGTRHRRAYWAPLLPVVVLVRAAACMLEYTLLPIFNNEYFGPVIW